MTDNYQVIYDILSNKGEEYASSYPEINDKNVFSISSLSWSVGKQVYWKRVNAEKQESKFLSLAMTRGRAIHEFIQRRLWKEGFGSEYPVTYQNERFKLIGHIDCINFKTRDILEIKSTASEKGEKWDKWGLQCGAYLKLIELETNLKFNAEIFCINEFSNKLTSQKVTDAGKELSWKTIIDRAEECYLRVFGK